MDCLYSINLGVNKISPLVEEKIELTLQQQAIAKIALALFAVIAVFALLYFESLWRNTVTVEDAAGKIYTSQIDKVNGKAKVIWSGFTASGAIVEGEFTNGKLNGYGKATFPRGKVAEEEGEFKEDHLNGQGKRTYRSGLVEEGTFTMGQNDPQEA